MTQPESSTAQNQALSSTEADELLDGLPAAPVVPPVPGQPDLPFNSLSPGQFERLCKRLIEQDAEVEHCYLYGKAGEKQFGIDIVARRFDGQRWAYQCKRYESYALSDLQTALEKLIYPANRHIFAISCSVGRKLRDKVEGRQQPTEIWGVHELSDKLRGCPDLVTQFFGPDWCRVFCGISPGLSVEEYLAAVKDYCRKLPYLSLHTLISGDADGNAPPSLGETHVRLQVQSRPEGRPLFVEQVLNEHTHFVILGQAGAGKSTLLRHLAECAWEKPESIGLDIPHLPVLVPLRRVAAAKGAFPDRLSRAVSDELALVQNLPEGFFTTWPRQAEARWLILLDGLDEVPERERPAIVTLIQGWARQTGEHRIIVTARLTGDKTPNMESFCYYNLLPFDPEQVSAFAQKWFGDDAENFQAELKRVRVESIAGTPLLLAIAAAVYWRNHELPPRRSGLYMQFVDIMLKEDEQRPEVREAFGDLLAYRWPILERIALWCQEELRGGLMPERDFEAQVESILREEAGLRPFEVEAQAARYVKVVRERGGLLVQRGDALDFFHSTFRDFLTARTLLRQPRPEVDEIIYECGANVAWREVGLFLLGLLSDSEADDLDELVRRILESDLDVETGPKIGAFFAAECLADQVRVGQELRNRIVDVLLQMARETVWIFIVTALELGLGKPDFARRYSPIAALGKLRGNERAVASLLALACDEKADYRVRLEAASTLERLGRAEEKAEALLALATKERVYTFLSGLTAYVLGEVGIGEEAVEILLHVAYDEGADVWSRFASVRALGELGHLGEATEILLALARDEKMDIWKRCPAASELGELGRTEELLALARDEQVDAGVCCFAAIELCRLDRTEEAAEPLLSLTQDEKVDDWVREFAADALRAIHAAQGEK